MHFKWFVISTFFFTIQGCVVFPISRTYFQPNPADGVPTRSVSCVYQTTSKDALIRDYENLHVQVAPSYNEDQPFTVSILIRGSSESISVKPENIQLKNIRSEKIFSPIEVDVDYQKPPRFSHFNHWLYLQYPPISNELEAISIQFNSRSVSVSGDDFYIEQFRFNKTKKADIFYGSINC